jgi:hypothetical protein
LFQHWGAASVALALTGLGVLVWGIWGSFAALAQSEWHKVTATILSSNIRYDGEMYYPEIEFEFEYQGIRRTGRKVRSNYVSSNLKRGALSICDRYRVGETVQAYVDPENVDRAVLEPGGDGRFLLFAVGISAFFILMAFAFAGH